MVLNAFRKVLTFEYKFTVFFCKLQKAFTLAEVLLTLLIIGIVASSTIPALINDVQNKDLQVQLKKTYSVLSDALKTVTIKNGNVPYRCAYIDKGKRICNCPEGVTCDDECFEWSGSDETGRWIGHSIPDPSLPDRLTDECSAFTSAIKSELRIMKSCNHAYAEGCLADVKTQDQIQADTTTDYKSLSHKDQLAQFRGCGDQALSFKNGPAYILSNGSVVFPLRDQKFMIDLNGRKAPNKWGYDIVQLSVRMTVDYHNLRLSPVGGCYTVEAGGKTTNELLLQALNN